MSPRARKGNLHIVFSRDRSRPMENKKATVKSSRSMDTMYIHMHIQRYTTHGYFF